MVAVVVVVVVVAVVVVVMVAVVLTKDISWSGCISRTLVESGRLIMFVGFVGANAPAIPVGPRYNNACKL